MNKEHQSCGFGNYNRTILMTPEIKSCMNVLNKNVSFGSKKDLYYLLKKLK
jgi:hypothetical protein